MADRIAFTQPQTGPGGYRRTMKAIGPVAMPILAADVGTISNTVQLAVIPAGFTVYGLYFNVPTSLAASALTLSVGDATTPARYLSASTLGVAGGQTSTIVAAGVGFKYTVDTNLQLTVAAAGVTPAAGTITVVLIGWMDL